MADVEFIDNSVKVISAINKAVNSFLEESASELESQVKRNSRVHFGQLKGSWDHKIFESKKEAVVGSPLENAIWEELGTGEYALKGNGRKGAWYVPADGYIGTKRPSYNGKVVIVRVKNGKKFYKTNGKRPTRAFHNAKITCEPRIIKHAQDVFGGMST